jgi:hypothetical protein
MILFIVSYLGGVLTIVSPCILNRVSLGLFGVEQLQPRVPQRISDQSPPLPAGKPARRHRTLIERAIAVNPRPWSAPSLRNPYDRPDIQTTASVASNPADTTLSAGLVYWKPSAGPLREGFGMT